MAQEQDWVTVSDNWQDVSPKEPKDEWVTVADNYQPLPQPTWGQTAVANLIGTVPPMVAGVAGSIFGTPVVGAGLGAATAGLSSKLRQMYEMGQVDPYGVPLRTEHNPRLDVIEAVLGGLPGVTKAPAALGVRELAKYGAKTGLEGAVMGGAAAPFYSKAETGEWDISPENIGRGAAVGGAFGAVTGPGIHVATGRRAGQLDLPFDGTQLELPLEGGLTQPQLPFPPRYRGPGDREVRWMDEPYLPYKEGPQQPELPLGSPANTEGQLELFDLARPATAEQVRTTLPQEFQTPIREESPPTVSARGMSAADLAMWQNKGYKPIGPDAQGYPQLGRPDVAPLYRAPTEPTKPIVPEESPFGANRVAAGETIEVPNERVSGTFIKNMKEGGYEIASKDSLKTVFKRFLGEEKGELDLEALRAGWQRLRRALGREPTTDEVQAEVNRIRATVAPRPGEPTGRVAPFTVRDEFSPTAIPRPSEIPPERWNTLDDYQKSQYLRDKDEWDVGEGYPAIRPPRDQFGPRPEIPPVDQWDVDTTVVDRPPVPLTRESIVQDYENLRRALENPNRGVPVTPDDLQTLERYRRRIDRWDAEHPSANFVDLTDPNVIQMRPSEPGQHPFDLGSSKMRELLDELEGTHQFVTEPGNWNRPFDAVNDAADFIQNRSYPEELPGIIKELEKRRNPNNPAEYNAHLGELIRMATERQASPTPHISQRPPTEPWISREQSAENWAGGPRAVIPGDVQAGPLPEGQLELPMMQRVRERARLKQIGGEEIPIEEGLPQQLDIFEAPREGEMPRERFVEPPISEADIWHDKSPLELLRMKRKYDVEDRFLTEAEQLEYDEIVRFLQDHPEIRGMANQEAKDKIKRAGEILENTQKRIRAAIAQGLTNQQLVDKQLELLKKQGNLTKLERMDLDAYTDELGRRMNRGEPPSEAHDIGGPPTGGPPAVPPTGGPPNPPAPEEGNWAGQVIRAPREIMATADLSAPLRQGLPMIHTKTWWTSWAPMLKSWGAKGAYDRVIAEIRSRPEFRQLYDPMTGKLGKSYADEVGLKLTDVTEGLTRREENTTSKWIAKYYPLAKQSNRAYTAYLNSLRADSFRALLDSAEKAGLKPRTDLTLGRAIAEYVNTATGRGSFGRFEQNAKVLANIFFSPRLMASRINMLNPMTYAQAPPFVRKQYLKSFMATAGAWGTFATLGAMMGAEVSLDVESSDFGKIKIGNTRLDPAGGFQQYLVAAMRLLTGRSKTSGGRHTTGGDFPASTRGEIAQRFLSNKLNPVVDFAYDLAFASKQRPVFVNDRIVQMFIPMIVTDVLELANEDPSMIPIVVPAAGVGMGAMSYERGKEQPKILSREYGLKPYAGRFEGGRIPFVSDVSRYISEMAPR